MISNWLHSGTIGDVWAAIPAMNQFYKNTGKKINLFLQNEHPAEYYDGAVHPTRNSKNEMVMLNQKVINMMIPLLMAQECICQVKVWDNEEINVNLDEIRNGGVGMPGLSINRWYFYVYPDLSCDLSGVWLNVPDTSLDLAKNKIIITRTERYRNDRLDYGFLKPYEDELLFCGTMREYNNFCMQFDLNVKMLNISNFLELAQAIKQCRFHITNQTQAFQLSEGLKIPRLLEVCVAAPNCIPIGESAYDYLSQQGLEFSFHKLYGDADSWMQQLIEKHKEKIPAQGEDGVL